MGGLGWVLLTLLFLECKFLCSKLSVPFVLGAKQKPKYPQRWTTLHVPVLLPPISLPLLTPVLLTSGLIPEPLDTLPPQCLCLS